MDAKQGHFKAASSRLFPRQPAPIDLKGHRLALAGYRVEAAGGGMFPGIDSTMKKIYYFLLAG
jgi:hypothetical protein